MLVETCSGGELFFFPHLVETCYCSHLATGTIIGRRRVRHGPREVGGYPPSLSITQEVHCCSHLATGPVVDRRRVRHGLREVGGVARGVAERELAERGPLLRIGLQPEGEIGADGRAEYAVMRWQVVLHGEVAVEFLRDQ